ncbi:restriction endonuclease [Spirulina subsalsa]|uniref:restriction endonuclease n=1 Tax=Spirulina subsalsa TaxID=54311 RepID=UPI0002E5718F|nr:restriction endonuclease [Spirulina subsalsa]
MNSDLIEHLKAKFKSGSSQYKVFALLSDQQWHCRSCEGKKVASGQYAGGGGIQGLERGNRSGRPGLVIETQRNYCEICGKTTTWDRWTGATRTANAAANIPALLSEKILKFYQYKDVIENRMREAHELIIDHRFPMQRWGQSEPSHDLNISDSEIIAKFQLLKKDSSGNHNLLKSRSCEQCVKTGKRGTPLGIRFWYSGGEDWSEDIPALGAEAEQGCVGCGWYNFEQWRNELNKRLAEY